IVQLGKEQGPEACRLKTKREAAASGKEVDARWGCDASFAHATTRCGMVKPKVKPTPPTPARSRIMRSIRGKGNATTELRMVAILRRERLAGWRRHLDLPGRPDFAWPSERVALFVDGCFWHGCPHCYRP